MPVHCPSGKGSCGLVQGPEMSVEMPWANAVAGHVGAVLNQLVSSGLQLYTSNLKMLLYPYLYWSCMLWI